MKTKLAEIVINEMESDCQSFIESLKDRMEGVLLFEKAPSPFICVCSDDPKILYVSLFNHDEDVEFKVTIEDLISWEDDEDCRKRALEFYRTLVARLEKEVEEDQSRFSPESYPTKSVADLRIEDLQRENDAALEKIEQLSRALVDLGFDPTQLP